MLRFLPLYAFAATRGDGLRPELCNLLERLAEARKATPSVAIVNDCHLVRIPTMRSGHTELEASTCSDLMPSTVLRDGVQVVLSDKIARSRDR